MSVEMVWMVGSRKLFDSISSVRHELYLNVGSREKRSQDEDITPVCIMFSETDSYTNMNIYISIPRNCNFLVHLGDDK